MSETKLESPLNTRNAGSWLRGNLHTHSTRSDGREEPQTVIQSYADLGHDFLFLSDHDVLADYEGLDPCGLILIPCNEVSAGGPHMLDVGAKIRVTPDQDRQKVIDQINAESGFAILNHPNWQHIYNHYPYELMLELNDYVGIEIYNGTCIKPAGSHLGINKWDRLLAEKGMVWGFANDDSHVTENVGRGWNVVWVKEKTPEAIQEALRTGCFYASNGVGITQLEINGSTVHIKTENADMIAVVGRYGMRLHEVEGSELTWDADECLSPHFRIECYGRGERMAWTQPIQILGGLGDRLRSLAKEKPEYKVTRVDTAPRLTGKIDDPAWESAEAASGFMNYTNAKPPSVQTSFQVLLAEEKLFFAFTCEEPELDNLILRASKDGDPGLWSDDSIELFIDSDGLGKHYFHFMLNAEGRQTCISCDPARKESITLDVHVGRRENAWTLELALPLSELKTDVSPGKRLGLHVCRNRQFEKKENSVWSFVADSNHLPQNYGVLVL